MPGCRVSEGLPAVRACRLPSRTCCWGRERWVRATGPDRCRNHLRPHPLTEPDRPGTASQPSPGRADELDSTLADLCPLNACLLASSVRVPAASPSRLLILLAVVPGTDPAFPAQRQAQPSEADASDPPADGVADSPARRRRTASGRASAGGSADPWDTGQPRHPAPPPGPTGSPLNAPLDSVGGPGTATVSVLGRPPLPRGAAATLPNGAWTSGT